MFHYIGATSLASAEAFARSARPVPPSKKKVKEGAEASRTRMEVGVGGWVCCFSDGGSVASSLVGV